MANLQTKYGDAKEEKMVWEKRFKCVSLKLEKQKKMNGKADQDA